MHSDEIVDRIIAEELEFQKKEFQDKEELWDFIGPILVRIMSARNHAATDTWDGSMKAHDEIREIVAIGIIAMQKLGYTRRYGHSETNIH